MSLSRRGDRSPLLGRHLRTAPLAPAVEQRQAVTMEIAPPAPPETIAVTEVIIQPEAPAQAAAPVLAVIPSEEALKAFGGRPLSLSATVRNAWFRENPGPEPTFRSVVADHADWAYLLDLSLPAPPRKSGSDDEEVADGRRRLNGTTSPVPGADTTAGERADETSPAPAPDAPGTAIPGPGESGEDADPVPAESPSAPGPVKSGTGRPAKKRAKGAGA